MNFEYLVKSEKKVGLLGGSFNPPHYGHFYISIKAIELLNLDYVIWLVTPKNPIKNYDSLLPLEERVKLSNNLINKYGINNIIVSDIEKTLSSTNTYDTINFLKQKYSKARFIWLMGSDCLINFHNWYKWKDIFNSLPIAVFDRETDKKLEESKTYLNYYNSLITEDKQSKIFEYKLPTWCLIKGNKINISSSGIRGKK